MCVSTWSGDRAQYASREFGPGSAAHNSLCCDYTTSCVTVGSCLSYVVEVSVWNFLLSCQLLHLIQQDVHLEFRAEVL